MNSWFGRKPFAPACEPATRVAIPIGVACAWCDDPIMPDDEGFVVPVHYVCGHTLAKPWHLNCQLRSLIGGLNHQRHVCGCFGGTLDADPAELTRREAADAAVAFWWGEAGQ